MRPLARKTGLFGEGVLKQALDSAGGTFRHDGQFATKRAPGGASFLFSTAR
jgi:hypothetical protein